MRIQSLGWEDPLEEGMAKISFLVYLLPQPKKTLLTHSAITVTRHSAVVTGVIESFRDLLWRRKTRLFRIIYPAEKFHVHT